MRCGGNPSSEEVFGSGGPLNLTSIILCLACAKKVYEQLTVYLSRRLEKELRETGKAEV